MRHYAGLTQLTILVVVASCWTLSVLHAFSPNPSFRPLGRLSSPWSSSSSSFHHSLANNNKRNRLLTTVLISQQEAPASTGSASDTPTSSSDTNATDASSSAATQDPSNPSDPSKRQPTLYEILGASPNATRAELKQSYVHLARQSHPDALLQNGDNESIDGNVDFSQVAAAWRILSQPQQRKRYDRSLEAQQFADSIEQWGADWTTQAMRPAADWSLQLLENVAMPLFRRTTATTLASLQALSKDLKQPQSSSSRMDSGSNNSTNRASTNATGTASVDATFSRAFRNAVQAARRAGRAVDRMELLEKSQALEARAQEELDRANTLQAQWHQTAQERLSLSLHTPKSGLTSRDAQVLLQVWNETTVSVENKQQQQQEEEDDEEDEGGVWSWVGRPSVKKEVRELSHAEGAFVQVQSQNAAAQDEYRTAVRERLLARTALVQAQTKAQEALKAYQAAQQNVADRSQQLDRAQHQVTVTELETKKSSIAVQRRASLLEKQSERVRQTLVAKEKQVLKERKKKSKSDDTQQQELPEPPFQQPHWLPPILQNTTAIQEENQERLERLASIQKEERALLEESSRMELQAARLLSRAQKLKRRADELETL